jgi:hypothetical protein
VANVAIHLLGELYARETNGGHLTLRYRLHAIFIPAPAAICPIENGALYHGLPSESRKTRLNVLAFYGAQISSSGGIPIVLSCFQRYQLLTS